MEGDREKASYGLGYTLAGNVKQRFADSIDIVALLRGVEDGMRGSELAVDINEAQAALQALVEARQAALAGRAEDNLAAGAAFLAENGKRDGVVSLPSGLQYEILEEGDGPKPMPTDTVTTHYHGTLIDETVFDSSYERGTPASFPLDGVIPGWTEALQLMPVGSKWRLYIPPALAYGAEDRGAIPANSTLIFDVELISIGQ